MSTDICTFRALVVDDDPNAIEYISYLLRREVPGLEITCRSTADVSGDFEIYLLDNDFAGTRVASRLTENIRLRNPNALVLAFSASLDLATLKGLLNAGCDAVADKSEPADQVLLIDIIQRYISAATLEHARVSQRRSTLSSVVDLLREWNKRYEYASIQQRTHAHRR